MEKENPLRDVILIENVHGQPTNKGKCGIALLQPNGGIYLQLELTFKKRIRLVLPKKAVERKKRVK